jgi:transcriptional accessory protein Tex/SPT6
MNMKRSLKSIEDLYFWYKKQVKEATTKSEIDIQLKRANTKGLEYLFT